MSETTIINNQFKLHYDEANRALANYYKEILDRILCVTAGFKEETFSADFSFLIPFDNVKNIMLSLYNHNDHLYIGIIDTNNKTIHNEADVEIFANLDNNTINYWISSLHQNEERMNTCRSFYPYFTDSFVSNLWNQYLQQNKIPTPTRRNYINVDKRELSVRAFYDFSVSTDMLEFSNWILRDNPSVKERESRIGEIIKTVIKKINTALTRNEKIKNDDLER